MKAYALLGGPKTEWPKDIEKKLRAAQNNGELLIGVDRGCLLLEEMGLIPDLAVGDFDSLRNTELAQVEKQIPDIRYSLPEKDFTDSELMVRYAFKEYRVETLTLYGATGGRLDHLLINLLLAVDPEVRPYAERLRIIDQQNFLTFYDAGKHKIIKREPFNYFGFASLTAVKNLNLSKAKYNLADYSKDYPFSFSSNEFLPGCDYFELDVEKGLVAVVQCKDIDRYQKV
ncbi:thiamine diphosphokinase [Lactobacillus sp. ESL0791]|uniref:thiamine diphosphokinase n=1 Tax=Lactobacillus sp. ESL0791 TaxID=2983234 RepID=UPI0023F822C6|nr:thiamine diphosphokinase [Lactobacillus sp. ESL0791]MDF7638739.1 thiamine diphosphokinase [Lactobacillus sp. ESL0791]